MRRILLIALSLALLSAALVLVDENLKRPTPRLKVGRDTTVVNGPLDAEGFVDFETALNTRLRGRSTPETNAVVLLLKVIGPKPEGDELPADFYRWLGVDPPPAEGEYLKSRYQHFQNELQGDDQQAFLDFEADLRQRPWRPEDSPKHAEWIRLNEKPLALAVEATRRPDYFYPLVARKEDGGRAIVLNAQLPLALKGHEIGVALALRATLKLGRGKTDEAFAEILATHRLSRLVSRGSTAVELVVVGSAIQALAHQGEAVIFEHGRPTAAQAMAYQRELLALPPKANVADKIALGARLSFLDTVQYQLRERVGDFLQGDERAAKADIIAEEADLDTTLRFGNWWFDRFETALRKPTRRDRAAGIAALERELEKLVEEAKHPESPAPEDAERLRAYKSERVAVTFLGLFTPPFERMGDASDGGEQIHRNGLLVTALGAHFADEKKYPDKLTELVPKYLKELPDDLFSGRELVYRKTEAGYLFYSVGPNGEDNGGTFESDRPSGDDIGVRMPRK